MNSHEEHEWHADNKLQHLKHRFEKEYSNPKAFDAKSFGDFAALIFEIMQTAEDLHLRYYLYEDLLKVVQDFMDTANHIVWDEIR